MNTITILQKALELDAPGQLIGLPELRSVCAMDKAVFDAGVLAMATAGAVSLHRHVYPAELTEAELVELVRYGDDVFCALVVMLDPVREIEKLRADLELIASMTAKDALREFYGKTKRGLIGSIEKRISDLQAGNFETALALMDDEFETLLKEGIDDDDI